MYIWMRETVYMNEGDTHIPDTETPTNQVMFTYAWGMSHMNEVTYEWVMSHMNELCHAWVMSHMNESCHVWMSHVTYEWAMSHMNESYHLWMSHLAYECVMSHMNESCHIHINETCHTISEWSPPSCVSSLTWMTWGCTHIHMWAYTYINTETERERHTWVICVPARSSFTTWWSNITWKWVISHMKV